jgi:UDPglucose 6-dehydrogenase
MRPNRVVIGATSQQAVAIMRDLYRPLYLIKTPILVTDIATAELIKYASNAFLAVKVSFIRVQWIKFPLLEKGGRGI